MLMLGANGAIEINVFRSSVNARVNADARCEHTLSQNNTLFVIFQTSRVDRDLYVSFQNSK